MKRILLLAILSLCVGLQGAMSQELHYRYRYIGTNYAAEGGGTTTMTNKGSSCKLSTNFTLSVDSDRKTAWVTTSSAELELYGNGSKSNGGYIFSLSMSEGEFWALVAGDADAYIDAYSFESLYVYSGFDTVVYISEEPATTPGKVVTRYDHYAYVTTVQPPYNSKREAFKRKRAEQERIEREEKAEREREERERKQRQAENEARMKATIGKPFILDGYINTHGESVDDSFFRRGKKMLVVTHSTGCSPSYRLQKLLSKYKDLASQVVVIHYVDWSEERYCKLDEPVSMQKLYVDKAKAFGSSWVYKHTVPYIFLLDEHGRVLSYDSGYNKEEDIAEYIEQLRSSNRSYPPYKVGDFYNDGELRGVVFEVSDNGYSGKIVSLERSKERLKWTTDAYEQRRLIFANSYTNGWHNLCVVKYVPKWFNKYPAFYWCSKLNGDWYLPAIAELEKLAFDKTVYEKVDSALVALNADMLSVKGDNGDIIFNYWSSSEIDRSNYEGVYRAAAVLNKRDNYHSNTTKQMSMYARGVATFGAKKAYKPIRTFAPYSIGDYYNDGEKEGVIFDVSADGRTGKIVNIYHYYPHVWCSDESGVKTLVGANSKVDGEYNLSAIKAIDGWQKSYPIFAWCAGLGDGWYIPADVELKQIYDVGRSIFPFLHNEAYWSSTEGLSSRNGIHSLSLSTDGEVVQSSKSYTMYACAVAKVDLGASKHKISSAPYKVGDYYNDGAREGVVFDVAVDGMSGKIVSMNQKCCYWSNDAAEQRRYLEIVEGNLGEDNLKIIQAIDDWQTKYPAFAWCAEHGAGWYLPTMAELRLLLFNSAVFKAVNERLSHHNAPMLCGAESRGHCWSSTEKDHKWDSGKYAVLNANMSAGRTYYSSKDNYYDVRAVAAFDVNSPTISEPQPEPTPMPTSAPYKVGDYYNDGEHEGVVYEVWDSGHSGKIISMTEAILPWSNVDVEDSVVTTEYTANGLQNMALVEQNVDWQAKYPAFAWCANLGEGWYLPSRDELVILSLDSGVYDSVNATLEAMGGVGLLAKDDKYSSYWSSTQSVDSKLGGYELSYTVDMNGVCSLHPKCFGYHVRAVSLFGATPRPKTVLARDKTSAPYAVGDYYNDGERDGVVFEVRAGGRHGKIVSMCEPSQALCWGKNNKLFAGCKSKSRGDKNSKTITYFSDFENKFPALAWCMSLGDGWYLPAIEELVVIYLNRVAINAGLANQKLKDSYWSSTEIKKDPYPQYREHNISAWYFDMDNGSFSYHYKSSSKGVRAVACF